MDHGERIIGRSGVWRYQGSTGDSPGCVDSEAWPITKRAISNGRTTVRRHAAIYDLSPPDAIHRAADCYSLPPGPCAQWAMRSFMSKYRVALAAPRVLRAHIVFRCNIEMRATHGDTLRSIYGAGAVRHTRRGLWSDTTHRAIRSDPIGSEPTRSDTERSRRTVYHSHGWKMSTVRRVGQLTKRCKEIVTRVFPMRIDVESNFFFAMVARVFWIITDRNDTYPCIYQSYIHAVCLVT